MQRLTIQQVEAQTDLPRRTIYYYIKEGLIPPPEGSRRSAMYSSEHVLKLWLIQALKEKTHLRLEGIKEILDGLSIEETRESLEGMERGELDPLDLVARVRPSDDVGWETYLAAREEAATELLSREARGEPVMGMMQSAIGAPIEETEETRPLAQRSLLSRFSLRGRRGPGKKKPSGGEQWRRVRLGDDVEFHYRETDDEERDARIQELVALAEEILGNRDRK